MKFTTQQEAEYRRVQADLAARDHADAISAILDADPDYLAAVIHRLSLGGFVTPDKLPPNPRQWSPYHAGMVHAALDYHDRERQKLIGEWKTTKNDAPRHPKAPGGESGASTPSDRS